MTVLTPEVPRTPFWITEADAERARAEGRPVVVRFKMLNEPITVADRVMGDVTIGADELDDFVIRKGDGMPTYHLANVVDDGLMKVTHVLRGQEFLAQTPRHIALQRRRLSTPEYEHLPLILDGRDASPANATANVDVARSAVRAICPVLLNFWRSWAGRGGRARTTDVRRDGRGVFDDRKAATNAKFDREKLAAFNTDAIASAMPERLLAAFRDYLAMNPESAFAGLADDTLRELLKINVGFRTFHDIETKSGFIFRPDDAIEYDPAAVKNTLHKGDNAGMKMLQAVLPHLESLEPWTAETIEALLKRICEEQNVGMGKVAQPIRVAVAGRAVSPAIGETLHLLGKTKTLSRVRRCLQMHTQS